MKDSNKGFTLIEILGVVIILGILLMIAGISVTKYIKNSQNKTYKSFEKNLRYAADNFMIDCISSNEDKCTIPRYGGSISLTYEELINKGYSEVIKDPESDGYCDRSYVIVKNKNSIGVKLDYQVCLLCNKYKTEGCSVTLPVSYNIKYDANGGNGTMSDTTCNIGTKCKISNNEFNFIDKQFAGWNTKKDGTGQYYVGGINVQNIAFLGETITLYATWIEPVDEEFLYTGNVQEYVIPATGNYQLEVYGAEGGYRNSNSYSGKGGYSIGTAYLERGTKLFIYVGGDGTNHQGYNGGGQAGYSSIYGGGATDIRINTDSLYARVIVAGGGGSVGASNKKGGAGGGETGGTTTESCFGQGCSSTLCGQGGTQTAGGAGTTNSSYTDTAGLFGKGGKGFKLNSGYGGAGGGGWYGGSGTVPDSSVDDDRGGGGGSGFIYTSTATTPSGYLLGSEYYLTSASMESGVRSGDGYAKIILLEA